MLQGRAKQLAARLPAGFGAALIGMPESRFYLLDFNAHDAGILLILPDRMVYFIDSRYIEAAGRQVTCAEVRLQKEGPAQLAELFRQAGVSRVMLETGITLAALAQLEKEIPFVEFDKTDTLSKALEALRVVKDEQALGRMRRAQAITDACFAHILPFVKEGVREDELALEMDYFMRKNGAEASAFDTICVAGPNSSLPHGMPGGYRLQPGDFITFDFGAKVDGYCSDMTRTVALGRPSAAQREVYGAVLKAHLAGIEAARAGRTGAEVDKAARDIVKAAGYGDAFSHGLGHGVGIAVHEPPRYSPTCGDAVPAGAVMTIEPGIYLAGRFGCRIEDMVLVTGEGAQPFPKSPKELIVV